MNKLQTFYWNGKILSLDDHPESLPMVLNDIQSGRVNWDLFFRLCDSQLMLPAIYLKFARNGLLSYIPEDLGDHLARIYKLNKERNEKILEQIASINTLLNHHGISPIYLKGAGHLLDNVYDDAGERFMFDIDFIVAGELYLFTAGLLEKDGYVPQNPYNPDNRFITHHYPRLIKPHAIAGIEIHWMPAIVQFTRYFHFDLINPEKRTPDTSMKGCYVLSYRHKIILNMIHQQLNDRGFLYAKGNLRQMNDLVLLSRKADPLKILEEFGYFRREAKAYLRLTNRVFGTPKKLNWHYNFATAFFIFRHDMNLRSSRWYHASQIILSLYDDPATRKAYRRRIMRAFRDKTFRRERLRRLFEGTLYSGGVRER